MNIFRAIQDKKKEFLDKREMRMEEQHKSNLKELERIKTEAKVKQARADTIKQIKTTRQELFKLKNPLVTKVATKFKQNLEENKKNKKGIFGDSTPNPMYDFSKINNPYTYTPESPFSQKKKKKK